MMDHVTETEQTNEIIDSGSELAEMPIEVELLNITADTLEQLGYVGIPFSDASSYGLTGHELLRMIDGIKSPGGEGIYHVRFPKGAKGSLLQFKSESAYMGTIGTNKGITAQARLTRVPFNPEQVLVAVALMGINHKLGEILETQKTILEFMHQKEEATLYGNINRLNEAIEQYKYNWDQNDFIDRCRNMTNDIQGDMHKSISLYRNKIADILRTPDTPHMFGTAGKKVRELSRLLRDYHDAQYLLAYAKFFETILQKNFSKDNLDNISAIISRYAKEYQSLFAQAHKWAVNYLDSSVDRKAAPVMLKIDRVYATILEKAPFGFDRFYRADSELYRPIAEQVSQLEKYEEPGTDIFTDVIGFIGNENTDLYLDGNRVFLPGK